MAIYAHWDDGKSFVVEVQPQTRGGFEKQTLLSRVDGLVAMLSGVPLGSSVKRNPNGVAFSKDVPTGGTVTVNSGNPRRITVPITEGVSGEVWVKAVRNALAGGVLPAHYIVSIEDNGATMAFIHPEDWEYHARSTSVPLGRGRRGGIDYGELPDQDWPTRYGEAL